MRTMLSYRECLGLDAPSRMYWETNYVNIIDGMSGSTDAQLSNIAVAFVNSTGGVVGSSDYEVAVNGTFPGPASPNNTVQINAGRAYVPNATGTMMYSTYHDTYSSGTSNVTIAPNSSGNPRIDAIVLYLNLAASPNAQATNVAGFYDVQGTPAGTPVAPTNSQILTAIGSGNPYIVLAYVAVANGFTSITSGNITDERSFASFTTGNVVPVPLYEEFTNQSSSPSTPASGNVRVYTKSDNNLYSKNSSGVETAIGTDTTFVGSFQQFVASGLTAPTSSSLATTIASGVVYYGGTKYSIASDGGHAYTASQDTYVDLTPSSGTYTYQGVSNGASAPSLTSSSIRIAKVVSGASTITSVTQDGSLDSLGNVIYPSAPDQGRIVSTDATLGNFGNTTTNVSKVTITLAAASSVLIVASMDAFEGTPGDSYQTYLYDGATLLVSGTYAYLSASNQRATASATYAGRFSAGAHTIYLAARNTSSSATINTGAVNLSVLALPG